MNYIGEFASGVWIELDSPATPSISSISGWAAANVGSLNILIDGEYFVSGGTFYIGTGISGFGNTEETLYKQIYMVKYYGQQIRNTLNGVLSASGSVDWISLREGDSQIQRTNRSELIKTYRLFYLDAQTTLDKLVNSYKKNLVRPLQVESDELTSTIYVTSSIGYR